MCSVSHSHLACGSSLRCDAPSGGRWKPCAQTSPLDNVLDVLTGYWWLLMELMLLGVLAWQLVSLRRDRRRAAEAERSHTD